jgi:hypothetical protein
VAMPFGLPAKTLRMVTWKFISNNQNEMNKSRPSRKHVKTEFPVILKRRDFRVPYMLNITSATRATVIAPAAITKKINSPALIMH